MRVASGQGECRPVCGTMEREVAPLRSLSGVAMRITVTENGPYLVSGDVPLLRVEIVTNEAGESIAWREIERIDRGDYALCRCGASSAKPYCDGSHDVIDFDGAETAADSPYFEGSACIDGPGLKLRDARELCAEARFCDREGGLWNLVRRAEEPGMRQLVEQMAADCPSGRYVVCDVDGETAHEPSIEPSIALIEHPSLGVSGPLWVRGGIAVVGADGRAYEVRNRVTLCRCGSSANKPFCDGGHIEAGFVDER